MSTTSCTYRIYPAWFGSDGPIPPMRELAIRSAASMGRRVKSIEQIGSGFDHCGGHFMEFLVTYAPAEQQMEAQREQ